MLRIDIVVDNFLRYMEYVGQLDLKSAVFFSLFKQEAALFECLFNLAIVGIGPRGAGAFLRCLPDNCPCLL